MMQLLHWDLLPVNKFLNFVSSDRRPLRRVARAGLQRPPAGRQFRILSIFNECSATKAIASSNLNIPSVHPRARVQEAPMALAKLRDFSKDQPSSIPVMKPAAKASPAPDSSTDLTW